MTRSPTPSRWRPTSPRGPHLLDHRHRCRQGTTYVEGSATDGATFADGKVTWSADLPSTYGEEGTYDITTSKTDDVVRQPVLGQGRLHRPAHRHGHRRAEGRPRDLRRQQAVERLRRRPTLGLYGEAFRGCRLHRRRLPGLRRGGQLGPDQRRRAVGPRRSCPTRRCPTTSLAGCGGTARSSTTRRPTRASPRAQTGSGLRIIEWDNHGGWNAPGDSLDMQVFLQEGSNDLVWVYDDIKADLSEVTDRHGERRRHQRRRRWSTRPTRPRRSPTGPSCA